MTQQQIPTSEVSGPDRGHHSTSLHFVERGGVFVCKGDRTSPCHNYPACECEGWTAELHGDQPEPGHENVIHDECWIDPWINAVGLEDSFEGDYSDLPADSVDGWRQGPIETVWHGDSLTWSYAESQATR